MTISIIMGLRRQLLVLATASLICAFLRPSTALAEPISATSNQSAKDLNEFSRIGFDLRGSRGGNGDVAASYLTATEFIERYHYEKPMVFIADDASLSILSRLTGTPVQSGSTLFNQIQIFRAEEIPKESQPIDLYIQLASPNQELRHIEGLGFGEAHTSGTVPLSTKAVLVTQTVFGNSENSNYRAPFGSIRYGPYNRADDWHDVHFLRTPGFDQTRDIGIYYDRVAERVSQMNPDERRQFVIDQAAKSKNQSLQAIFEKRSLRGAKAALAYGLWSEPQQEQFATYLKGLAARRPNESFVFVSPLDFDSSHLPKALKKKVVTLGIGSPLPLDAKPGTIYIQKTPFLNHELFTGLIGASEIPPVIAGDNAVSAAGRIGRPFLMTRVPWNEKNIEQIGVKLENSASSKDEVVLSLFPNAEADLSLERGIELDTPERQLKFKNLSRGLRFQSETMIEAAANIRRFEIAKSRATNVDEMYRQLKPFLSGSDVLEVRIAAVKAFVDYAESKGRDPFEFKEIGEFLRSEKQYTSLAFQRLKHAPPPSSPHFWEDLLTLMGPKPPTNGPSIVGDALSELSGRADSPPPWPPRFTNGLRELLANPEWFVASHALDILKDRKGPFSADDFSAIVLATSAGGGTGDYMAGQMPEIIARDGSDEAFRKALEGHLKSGDPTRVLAAEHVLKVTEKPGSWGKDWSASTRAAAQQLGVKYERELRELGKSRCSKNFARIGAI